MMRTLFGSALAVALLAGSALADDGFQFGGGDYYADGNTPIDGNCPTAHGAHGAGLGHKLGHKFGHHYGGVGGVAYDSAYAAGYPNGVDNYGEGLSRYDFVGPGKGCRTCSNGDCQYRFYGTPDLFYNYYAWPSCTGLGAEMYVAPRPVPPHVGHTFYTYQPLYPHEYLYDHHRTYHRYYNGGQGLNRTMVKYKASWWPSHWPANTCH